MYHSQSNLFSVVSLLTHFTNVISSKALSIKSQFVLFPLLRLMKCARRVTGRRLRAFIDVLFSRRHIGSALSLQSSFLLRHRSFVNSGRKCCWLAFFPFCRVVGCRRNHRLASQCRLMTIILLPATLRFSCETQPLIWFLERNFLSGLGILDFLTSNDVGCASSICALNVYAGIHEFLYNLEVIIAKIQNKWRLLLEIIWPLLLDHYLRCWNINWTSLC